MLGRPGDTAILVTSSPAGIRRDELERKAAAGERPRKDYVELARLLDADIIDGQHMEVSSARLPRLVSGRLHFKGGQIAEALLRPRYRRVVAWGDYLGLCMATLFKLTRSSRQLTVVSYNATGRPHGALLRQLRVHTHVHAFFYQSSVQMEAASSLLEVPRHKLRRVFHPVDERFWRPMPDQAGSGICAAGLEARDYATLLQAVHDMPVTVHLALASTRLVGPAALRASGLDRLALAGNVRLITPSLLDLRLLYATSRFVVVPLAEVDNDAGATVITEAMAMGKAVILTRNRGQVDIVRDREHGLYVPPRDPAALRSAIRYLLENPDEAERMGRAGRAHIEARHRLDAYVGSLADAAQEPGPLLRQPEQSPASQGA